MVEEFLGCAKVMWWTYTELMETGRLTKTITLEKGKGALKSGRVGGQLKVELILPRFSDKVEQRGDLSVLFPLMAADEAVSLKAKVMFSVAEKPSDDLGKLRQVPGMLFLLKKRFYLHAFTRKDPIAIDTAYSAVENTDQDAARPGTVLVALKDRRRFVVAGLLDAAGVLSTMRYHIGACTTAENEALQAKAISANERLVAQPAAPATLFLKVYIPDSKELGCDPGYVLALGLRETFRKGAERLLRDAGVSAKDFGLKKFRFFTVPPAARMGPVDVQKIDSKLTGAEALAAGLVACGSALTFRDYDKKVKARMKNKARLAGAAATVFVHVVYCVNAQTKFEPVTFEINRSKPFHETMVKPIVKKHGMSVRGVRLFLCGYSSDIPNRTIDVEIPVDSTPAEEFITDHDLLAVKVKPPFASRADKFGTYEERYEIYSLLCHCYIDPLHRKSRDKSVLPKVAVALGLAGDRCSELENMASEHALYGGESVLVELADRLSQARFHPFYTPESFASPEIYQRWLQEQRNSTAALMRAVVFDSAPFAAELYVGVVKGKDLPPTDDTGLVDAYVTVIYKTQRRSTEVAQLSLNPFWDASLYFNITSIDSPLIFYVFNRGHSTSDPNGISPSGTVEAGSEIEAEAAAAAAANGESDGKKHGRAQQQATPELIGTAQIDLREQVALLNGDKHEVVLRLMNGNKRKGSLLVTLHCFFETVDYINKTRTAEIATRFNTPYKFQVKKYYDTLYEALGEPTSTEEQRPWILREFGERYGVSDIYCSALKLRDLLTSKEPFSPHMSKAIAATTICLARPAVIPNAEEADLCDGVLRDLFAKASKVFLPLCFASTDNAVELTEPLVSALAEVVEQESSYGDLYKMLSSALTRGVNKQYAAINQQIRAFDDTGASSTATKCPTVKNVVQTLNACISDDYDNLFNKIIIQIKAAIPHDLQDPILGDFVDCLNDIVNDSLSRVSILITSVVDEDSKEEPARTRRYADVDAAISHSKSSKSKSKSKSNHSHAHKGSDASSPGGSGVSITFNSGNNSAVSATSKTDAKKKEKAGKPSFFKRVRRKSTEVAKRKGGGNSDNEDSEYDTASTTSCHNNDEASAASDFNDYNDSNGSNSDDDDKKKKKKKKPSSSSSRKKTKKSSKKKKKGTGEEGEGEEEEEEGDGDEEEAEYYVDIDTPLTDLIYDLIMTVAKFKSHVEENSGQVLELTHYTGLMMIWLKKTGERFRAAVKHFVEADPRERFGRKEHYSRSVVEVEEYYKGAIALLKQMQVFDPFVWSQVTELVMSSLLYYFNEESRIAIEKLNQKDDDDDGSNENGSGSGGGGAINSLARGTVRGDEAGLTGAAQLVELSISISNIEKGQKTFDGFIEWIEETTDKWKDTTRKRDIGGGGSSGGDNSNDDDSEDGEEEEDEDKAAYNERVNVSLEAVNAAITNAAKDYKRCIIDPLREIGRLSSVRIKEILENGTKAPEGVSGRITEHYDGYVCRIKECISKKIYGHALEELWNSFIATFWEVIRPESPLQSNGGGLTKAKVAAAYEKVLADVVAYFGTDESRLAASILERGETYLKVKQTLGLYTLDSATLIKYFQCLTHRPPLPLEDELYSTANPNYILFVLKNRFDDKAAQEFFQNDEASDDSERIRQTLGLPMTEIISKKWRCTYNSKTGSAYLSSSYFIFISDDGSAMKIALADVSAVSMSKILLFFKGLTIQIYNQTYNFAKFEGDSVEDILPAVKVQCALAGNTRI